MRMNDKENDIGFIVFEAIPRVKEKNEAEETTHPQPCINHLRDNSSSQYQ